MELSLFKGKDAVVMKKMLSAALAALLLSSVFSFVAFASSAEYPLLREEVRIRDPFVLVYEGKYYMYGTGLKWNGYGCVVSEDLERWSEPRQVFEAPVGFDGVGDWWAPECHYYNGGFYLFATYRSAASGKRGTAIFRASSPLGPFTLLSDGHVTPKYRDCIDGTLYVDEAGQPWIVYVGEWTSNEDSVGVMCAAMLSADLSHMTSEPITLFRATDAKWASGHITDGPFVYRSQTGRLLMLWSNGSGTGYAVGIAQSVNGKITGRWTHKCQPLYQKDKNHIYDGGHGMLFTDLNGRLRMAIHAPNTATDDRFETAEFILVTDLGFTLAPDEGPAQYSAALEKLSRFIRTVYHRFEVLTTGFRRFVSSFGGGYCA